MSVSVISYLIRDLVSTGNFAVQKANEHVRHFVETSLVDLTFVVPLLGFCKCGLKSIGSLHPEESDKISDDPRYARLRLERSLPVKSGDTIDVMSFFTGLFFNALLTFSAGFMSF